MRRIKQKRILVRGVAVLTVLGVALLGYFIFPRFALKIEQRFSGVDKTEIEFLSGNLRLRGTLYAPSFSLHARPGIVLCHGGTSIGRRLAIYVVMAEMLVQQGYTVLTFDFRGFGESEDPHRFRSFSDLDFVQDVTSALTYLSAIKRVDASQLFVVGHSFGAGIGVMAGIRDPRVKKVVSISPGRRTEELYFGANASNPEYAAIRMSQDMHINPPIPKDFFYPILIDYVAEAIDDYPVHPPVLLIDGGRESQKDLDFLRDVYKKMTPPKAYTTIDGADHYFGTQRNQDGTSGHLAYDKSVMMKLVTTIEEWFSTPAAIPDHG